MATSQVETVSTTADKAKLGLAVILLLSALVGFYGLSKQGQLVQWAALLVGLAAAVAAFLSAESGRQLIAPIAMETGLRFAIREGGRTVGSGVVATILA